MVLALGLVSIRTLSAGDSSQVSTCKSALAGATAYELPVKAAGMVVNATDANRETTTIAVVRAAFELNPSATITVVGAIAQAAPSRAAIAAKTAVNLQPKLIVLIVRAATASAVVANPAQVGGIVEELCRAFPSHYNLVAITAATHAPDSAKEILAGVVAGVPSLKPYIDQASQTAAANNDWQVNKVISLAALLVEKDQHAALADDLGHADTASLPLTMNIPVVMAPGILSHVPMPASHPPPVLGPPFTPQPPNLLEINPGDNSPLWPGGYPISPPPPILGPPFTPLPPTVIEINPGDNSPEGPGGHNYSPP